MFICWHSGLESTPRQLHINLVSSLYLFSSALLPGLIYGSPCHGFLLSQGQGALWYGCSGLRQEQDLSLRVVQSLAICVTGINLDQAFPHLLMSYHVLWLCLEGIGKGELGKLDPDFQRKAQGWQADIAASMYILIAQPGTVSHRLENSDKMGFRKSQFRHFPFV